MRDFAPALKIKVNFMKSNKNKTMYFDVILSFEDVNEDLETQEFYYAYIPVPKDTADAKSFLDNYFFDKVIGMCNDSNRPVEKLWKISTAADWDLFEKSTGIDGYNELQNNGKWYFGNGRDDLDSWEIELMAKYGFGSATKATVEESIEAVNMLVIQKIIERDKHKTTSAIKP